MMFAPAGAWCPQCGPGIAVDDDGCCASCGADAMGYGADLAVDALAACKAALEEHGKSVLFSSRTLAKLEHVVWRAAEMQSAAEPPTQKG